MITVERVMTTPVITVSSTTTICDVENLFNQCEINQMPVMANGKILGIVTKRDVQDIRWTETYSRGYAQDIMTIAPVTTAPEELAVRAAQILDAFRYSALPVCEKDQLIGIVTINDILTRFRHYRKRNYSTVLAYT